MEKLSIEEKAKAYDKALERAKECHIDGLSLHQPVKDVIEHIFPELKESEDEKIRKEMIFYFTEEIPQCSIQEHSDKMREFISWLKRQEVERTKLELKAGNSYFCYKSRWERADSETFKKGLIYKCNKDGVLDNFVIKNPEQHFIKIKDEHIAWLEKQKENIDNANKEYWRGYREGKQEIIDKYNELEKQGKIVDYYEDRLDECACKYFNKGYKHALEKQRENKTADKDEPKFKVGDWITNGATKPAQISSIEDDMYYTHNGTIGWDIEYMDKDYHLWTIADAKDGDVLSDGTTIFIFKDLLSDDSVISHCDYDTDSGKGYVFCPLSMNLMCSKITPATKEQCNLLFQKIKENGYEWDAEKKELKKIEQKPTQETKPFKVEHGKYYYCIKDCFCGGKKQASKGDVVQALRGLPIMSLKDASEYFLPVNFIKEIW